MKFIKLFCLSVFLVIGCCFSTFATREHFNVDDELVAIYEFMESEEFGGTGLFIHAYAKGLPSEDNRMDKFGEYIRRRCQINQINLRVLATSNLIYSLDKNFDLKIEANGRCTDFNIHRWAMTTLGIGEFKVCNEVPYESERFEERARMSAGRHAGKQEEPSSLFMCWESKKLRDIIIADPRISADEYASVRSPGGDGWFNFTHQAANFCRNLVIMDRVYPCDTVPRALLH